MSVVRSACYSGVRVYEVLCRNVPVMRRKVDSYINATQILRAAGLPKPARTKVLERDVVMGVHEKIQGGYAGFQGTWVPLDSAISLAEAHGMLDDLRCLFEYDVASGEAEKNMVARVRRAPVSIIPKEEEPQAGEEYDPSSSEIDDENPDRPRRTPARAPRFVPTPPTSARSPRSRRKKLFSGEHAGDDDDSTGDFGGDTSYGPDGNSEQVDGASGSFIGPDANGIGGGYGYGTAAGRLSSAGTPRSVGGRGQGTPKRSLLSSSDRSPLPDIPLRSTPSTGSQHRQGYPRFCEVCGATETPQWRRGPSGKRTLCNACGVKWSSGRLLTPSRPASPFGTLNMANLTSAESGDMDSSDPTSPYDDLELEVGSTAWKLRLEVRQLRSKLREMERGQKRLRKLLAEAIGEDRTADRSYRKVMSTAKRSRIQDDHGDALGFLSEASVEDMRRPRGGYLSGASGMDDDEDDEDDDDNDNDRDVVLFHATDGSRGRSMYPQHGAARFGDESEREQQHERMAIGRFVRAVKRSKVRMVDRLLNIRLPLS